MSAGLAERLVMRDIAAGFAIAVDTAAISGSGSGGEPFGLLQSPGLGTFSGTTLSYATLLGAERAVLAANGLGQAGELAWACTPATAEILANRQAFSSTQSLWSGKLSAGTLIGCPGYTSMTIPTGRLIGGDFSQLMIAQWGALELRVNPYQQFQADITNITGFLSVDICTMRPSAFAVSSNAVS